MIIEGVAIYFRIIATVIITLAWILAIGWVEKMHDENPSQKARVFVWIVISITVYCLIMIVWKIK
jgi:hypothetical protein